VLGAEVLGAEVLGAEVLGAEAPGAEVPGATVLACSCTENLVADTPARSTRDACTW